ncbi:uncharacterized protein LOC135487225 isoform X2 [Lineus longissimus]|uniref:uncharacterized protein LOC135487225 isoform X2 n=1 Tax=Lineus longissimus TaxID=88925 RepID=UPI00315DAD02
MVFVILAWSLTVAAALLLLPGQSESCSVFGHPKGTKTTRACAGQSAAQLEHGRTEHLPEPVGDFIIKNYGAVDQVLVLTVTLISASLSDWMEEAINHDDVRAEIYYSTSEYCVYVSCPDAHNFTCVVRNFQDINSYLLIAVNVSDNKGNWKKHCLKKLQTLPRAKAAAVDNFKVTHLNSSTVDVSWRGTVLTEANHPVRYRVKLSMNNFNHQEERIYYGTPPNRIQNRTQQHQITGLISHGVYSVTLTVQPVTLDDAMMATGFSSDPVSRSVTMPEDVPARNPHWAPGKFSIDDCGDSGYDCKSTSITIYWQALQEIFRNGMIQYIVTVKNISRTNSEGLLTREKIAANKTSYQIKDLNKGTTYKVELEAATAKGTNSSADPSVFNLDENTLASPRPSRVEAIKPRDHRSILVTWKGARGSNYSVVWCREGKNDQVGKCKGTVWSLSVGTATSVKVPLTEKEERYRVGVWMDDGTAGIVWSSCVFQEGVSPKAVPPADIYSQTGHLVVKVKKYRCEDSAAPITSLKYYVNYCLTNDKKTCSGEVTNKRIGPDEINKQFVYAVEPNHFYKVTIYAEAEGGRSPKLVQNHFVPMSTKGRIFGAAFGSVVAGLFIIGVIVSLVFYRKHVKKYPVHIEKVSTVALFIDKEDGDDEYEEFPEEDLMIRSVEPDNPIEECNTGVEEQHPLTRKMQPDMLTPEEDIPQNYIDDYARVTFTTEMMIARLAGLEDLLKRRERPGEADVTREVSNKEVEPIPEIIGNLERMDEDMASTRSSISNIMNSVGDYSGNGHFESIEVPESEDIQMPETDDNSGDEWKCYDHALYTEDDDTDSEGDSEGDGYSLVHLSTQGYLGDMFGGNGGVKSNEGYSWLHSNEPGVTSNGSNAHFHSNGVNSSNDEYSGLHSKSMDSNENDSTADDFDSLEDYSKFRPLIKTNERSPVLCPLSSFEEYKGIHESGLDPNGDGATLSVLPPLRDDFMID